MPLNKKRRSEDVKKIVINEDENNQSGSSSESDTESVENKEVTINFTGYIPESCDVNGLILLLRQSFVSGSINLKELSELIVKQDYLGSIVKESVSDDEDDYDPAGIDMSDMDDIVYSVTTVVNIAMDKCVKCVQQLMDFVINKSKEHASDDVVHFVNNLFNDDQQKVGFIINERFINLPQSVAEPSLFKLMKEIKNTAKTNPLFKFTYYVLISKCSKIMGSTKKKSNLPIEASDEIIWSNSEDDIFDKEAEVKFDYSVSDTADTGLCGAWSKHDQQTTQLRRVLIIPADKFKKVVKLNFCQG